MSVKASFELVPGSLHATVHLHEINSRSGVLRGWTMVSEGLTFVGQPEMAFTLARTSDRAEDFPSFLLKHLPIVRQLASEGRTVGEGGATAYRPGSMEALGPFAGIGYTAPDRSLSVPLPPVCLIGLLLTEGELEMWMRCFPDRVLSKLGQLHQYFPYPFWSDVHRQSVYAPGDAETSLMSTMRHVRAEGSSVNLTGHEINLRLRPADANLIADRVEAGEGFSILVSRNPSVQAALVWEPGQDEATAIAVEGTDGSVVAGWFVILAPGNETIDHVRMLEDGFGVVLTEASTGRLVRALRQGEHFRVSGGSPSRTMVIGIV